MKSSLVVFLLFSITFSLYAQKDYQFTGGVLSENQASYNIIFYDLSLEIMPDSQFICGSNKIHLFIESPIDEIQLNLDSYLTVDSVSIEYDLEKSILDYWHIVSSLFVYLPKTFNTGESLVIKVFYHGNPRIAQNPPWIGGFSWEQTHSGDPWVGVTCQNEGADVWWPCKDHPSDEPDSMAINLTFSGDLECISNGILLNQTLNPNGTKTNHWFVPSPINNYVVSFYLAPYLNLNTDYTSVNGATIPLTLWYLEQESQNAEKLFPYLLEHVQFLENLLGPYPFYDQKLSVVQSSYLGMEHQTVIAYGDFDETDDHIIQLHELSHEWWGNLVTVSDWKDIWLHEGFATYMEWLYLEEKYGLNRVRQVINDYSRFYDNVEPIVFQEPKSLTVLNLFDTYKKGANVLHTLRYLLGKEELLSICKTFLYPDSVIHNDHIECRLVTVEEFTDLVEKSVNRDLDWFFNAYLYKAELPVLYVNYFDYNLELYWNSKEQPNFFMPVDIVLNRIDTVTVDLSSGYALIDIMPSDLISIDPYKWVLKNVVKGDYRTDIQSQSNEINSFVLNQNYPNPFNPNTNISFSLPRRTQVRLEISNIVGQCIAVLTDQYYDAGHYSIPWNGMSFPSGIYFYTITTDTHKVTRKMVLIE